MTTTSMLTAESWICVKCRSPRSAEALQTTITDRFLAGHCRVCRGWRQFRRPTGEELKAAGIAAVDLAAGQGTDAAWQVEARRAIEALAELRVQFTANDVTERAGLPSRRNAVGAALNSAARRGTIRKVGFRSGDRPSQHARVLAVWEGAR